MLVRVWSVIWLGIACAVAGAQRHAQGNGAANAAAGGPLVSTSLATALTGLGNRAGVIFVGRVTGVERSDESGFVDVAFYVEQAVRGCRSGSTYVLREWAGLWTGESRYELGQRRLMLLAARSASGMSAPVGGMAGAIPVTAGRLPPLVHGTTPAPPETAAETKAALASGLAVDLRWVQALMVRRAAIAEKGWEGAASAEQPMWLPGPGPVRPLPPVFDESVPGPSLSSVLALLGQTSAP